jgi:hypothetical protein
MSAGGPLLAVGLAFFFAGLLRVITKPRPLDGLPLVVLGAAVICAAAALLSKGV